ncbi:MAG: hypothetical protein P0116_17015 [Candidatus Nitrosocosmicus sp.]|nr:hypothetical protein [Candidatus Nitrosocosmicus sp.]MDF0682662.1 hypothetical protein [Candidatus Nitrosocosmicus sp.]
MDPSVQEHNPFPSKLGQHTTKCIATNRYSLEVLGLRDAFKPSTFPSLKTLRYRNAMLFGQ